MPNDFSIGFAALAHSFGWHSWVSFALKFFPFVLLLELPIWGLVMAGMIRYGLRELRKKPERADWPSVSCIVLCYSEGEGVIKSIRSLALQRYPGNIEIIAVIDGAIKNAETRQAVEKECARWQHLPGRRLMPVPKWQRGGRVSSLNLGLAMSTGDIIMALDGDTSFDNDMIANATVHFADPTVAAVSGNLRVRNQGESAIAKLQGLEYVFSISGGRTGLSEFNLVNNVSGAFGIFRATVLRHLGGWDAGTAEDLDLTLRIKQFFGRHPDLRIVFEPHAVGHTDAPATWRSFFGQRVRWDGDLFYIYIRKYRFNLRPSLLGWRNFLFVSLYGLVIQLTLPFLIAASAFWMFWTQPVGVALGTLTFIYLCYLITSGAFFLVYLAAISERPRFDLGYLPWLPLFPLYGFVNRVHNAYSTLCEILTQSHLDSSMAPTWVLRRTKF
ncbi:MAG: glycosyltransferase [Zoogloeaceae bacterium]|nr:glycosyltransferase [Zoogloeaceae bacterium]